MEHTSDGALASSEGSTHGRASGLDGHLGGQAGSDDAGSHCDGFVKRGVVVRLDKVCWMEGIDGGRRERRKERGKENSRGRARKKRVHTERRGEETFGLARNAEWVKETSKSHGVGEQV